MDGPAVGIAIGLVIAALAIVVWRRRHPYRPEVTPIDITTRERRQMLFHDDEPEWP
jgi:hypothetical protein